MDEEVKLSTSEEKGWLGKIKESLYENWQTVLVALIVLIVGIGAYNYNTKGGSNSQKAAVQEQNSQQNADVTATDNQEASAEQKDQAVASATDQAATDTKQAAPETKTEVKDTKTQTDNTKTTTATDDGSGYKVVAVKGEGTTHLARKALNQYLQENKDDQVTALHKIYIEDYLRKKAGSGKINIGHEETFSKSMIQEAIDHSKKLSQKSLDNLKKYQAKVR